MQDLLYNKALKYIERFVGDDVTTSTDLHTFGKRFFGNSFKGVYASDKIPFLSGISKYMIVNLDQSYLIGSHWVAVAKKNNKLYVYDSFGRKTKKILPALFKKHLKVLDSEYDAEQKVHEQNCGARSLAWLFIFKEFGSTMAMKI